MFLRWTSTENMFADAGAKLMDTSHLRRVLREGQWSIEYQPSFIKTSVKKAKPGKVNEADSPPGTAVDSSNPVLQFLQTLSLCLVGISRMVWLFKCHARLQRSDVLPLASVQLSSLFAALMDYLALLVVVEFGDSLKIR